MSQTISSQTADAATRALAREAASLEQRIRRLEDEHPSSGRAQIAALESELDANQAARADLNALPAEDTITVTIRREHAAALVEAAAESRDAEQEAADESSMNSAGGPMTEDAAWRKANVQRIQEAINTLTMAGLRPDDIAALPKR